MPHEKPEVTGQATERVKLFVPVQGWKPPQTYCRPKVPEVGTHTKWGCHMQTIGNALLRLEREIV